MKTTNTPPINPIIRRHIDFGLRIIEPAGIEDRLQAIAKKRELDAYIAEKPFNARKHRNKFF